MVYRPDFAAQNGESRQVVWDSRLRRLNRGRAAGPAGILV